MQEFCENGEKSYIVTDLGEKQYVKDMTKRQIKKIKRKQKANKRKEAIRQKRFMKLVIFSLFMLTIVFTVIILVIFALTGNEPSTLIENFFQFTSIEGGAMALIKMSENIFSGEKGKKSKVESAVDIGMDVIDNIKDRHDNDDDSDNSEDLDVEEESDAIIENNDEGGI